ncbi:phosphonate metabolism protein PhnM [Phyllobacterium sophorae]|uniref:Phosphonate metabolism protein PhnM n=2 Tax=Phyllobacterium sophorae TaxID=1520277 RepID=A0A2P7AQW2_9HYPH|nr:phosphonate metabolism protein PhnM [Phyllobacterium sophorae]
MLVLEDRVVAGQVHVDGGMISGVTHSDAANGASIDCDGDFLLPGLIDLHTDNVECHFFPRPGVQWPIGLGAVLAHDQQMVCAGITTVLDSLALGDYQSGGGRARILRTAIEEISRARNEGLFRAEHFFHFRCEVSDPLLIEIVERFLDLPALRLLSVMDHTPGQRQWRDLALFRNYRREKKGVIWTDPEFEQYLEECRKVQEEFAPKFRRLIHEAAVTLGVPVASHDDTTVADVEESHSNGISLSEFPTTVDAARRARELGMLNIMGSPNIVLGGSHSGNVSAAVLSDLGLLDILTSDYVPSSLLQAPFMLADRGVPLHSAVAMVTATPANAMGFSDRGRVAPGLRADLVRIRLVDGVPVVRSVWVAGRQYL